ncbi:MAG TPA: hypothetical protein PKZ84_21770 [Anaerolineae bacterium]|nr:hypothetical protein [Anaerolineae bacterium]HQI87206.1 hypothetical protein [Anaerolineae bacterium]
MACHFGFSNNQRGLSHGISNMLAVAFSFSTTVADAARSVLLAQITDLLIRFVQSRAVQVLDVTLEGEASVINLDCQILDNGVFDPALQLSQSYFGDLLAV